MRKIYNLTDRVLMDALTAARKETGASAVFIAKKAGISPKTLSDIMYSRQHPHRITANAIATALGLEFDDLFYFGKDEPARPPKKQTSEEVRTKLFAGVK